MRGGLAGRLARLEARLGERPGPDPVVVVLRSVPGGPALTRGGLAALVRDTPEAGEDPRALVARAYREREPGGIEAAEGAARTLDHIIATKGLWVGRHWFDL